MQRWQVLLSNFTNACTRPIPGTIITAVTSQVTQGSSNSSSGSWLPMHQSTQQVVTRWDCVCMGPGQAQLLSGYKRRINVSAACPTRYAACLRVVVRRQPSVLTMAKRALNPGVVAA